MKVVTITMLKDERGSPDGLVLRDYAKGVTYDVPQDLAKAFVEDMQCAVYGDRASPSPVPSAAVKRRVSK